MAAKRDNTFQFGGFESPNTTPVPDVVFDVLLARLKETELKALLYIIRRTFGFKKNRDPISFNQFLKGITTRDGKVLDQGCGVRDRTTLSRALKSLEDMGIVLSEKGVDERGENATTIYSLKFKGDHPEVVGNSHHPSRKFPPPVVGNSYQQETGLQETDVQDIYPSNIRKTSIPKKDEESDTNQEIPATRDISEASSTPSLHDEDEQDTPALRWTPRRDRLPDPSERARSQPTSLADVLSTRTLKQRSRVPGTNQKRHSQEHQQILAFIEDFARELGDEAPLQSSVSRALNLYTKSGIPMEAFLSYLYEARSITKEYSANVTKQRKSQDAEQAGFWPAGKNKMPYFFGILEELTTQRGTSVGPSG